MLIPFALYCIKTMFPFDFFILGCCFVLAWFSCIKGAHVPQPCHKTYTRKNNTMYHNIRESNSQWNEWCFLFYRARDVFAIRYVSILRVNKRLVTYANDEYAAGSMNSYTNHVRNICHINDAKQNISHSRSYRTTDYNRFDIQCHVEVLCDYWLHIVCEWSMYTINFLAYLPRCISSRTTRESLAGD